MNANHKREQSIINSVFQYETKRVTLSTFQVILFYIVLAVLLYGFGSTALDFLIENDIHTLPGSLITDWSSVVYALQASYELATFAVPIWAQVVIILLITILVLFTIQVTMHVRTFYTKSKQIMSYWIRRVLRTDFQT